MNKCICFCFKQINCYQWMFGIHTQFNFLLIIHTTKNVRFHIRDRTNFAVSGRTFFSRLLGQFKPNLHKASCEVDSSLFEWETIQLSKKVYNRFLLFLINVMKISYVFIDLNCLLRWAMWPMGLLFNYFVCKTIVKLCSIFRWTFIKNLLTCTG